MSVEQLRRLANRSCLWANCLEYTLTGGLNPFGLIWEKLLGWDNSIELSLFLKLFTLAFKLAGVLRVPLRKHKSIAYLLSYLSGRIKALRRADGSRSAFSAATPSQRRSLTSWKVITATSTLLATWRSNRECSFEHRWSSLKSISYPIIRMLRTEKRIEKSRNDAFHSPRNLQIPSSVLSRQL